MNPLRSLRWTDFRRRAEYAPATVYRHRTSGWEYIPIHPFGDEPELLARLHLCSEDCLSVDAWWGIEGDATLLETRVSRPPGLYAQGTSHEEHWVYLQAILDAPYITRVAFESVMSRFVEFGFPSGDLFQLPAGSGLIHIANH